MLSAIVHARGSGLGKWLTVQHIPCWRKLVPHELNVLALENPRLFYDLLFAASAQTLLEIASDPKHLGAEIGVIAILHTWGQNLLLHPHIHCVITAGGLSLDHRRWVHPRYPFFLSSYR